MYDKNPLQIKKIIIIKKKKNKSNDQDLKKKKYIYLNHLYKLSVYTFTALPVKNI